MKKRIEKMIPTVLSLAIALFFGSFLFMAVGYNPVSVYSEIIYGAVGTHGAVLNFLVQATPLLFTGLAFVIAIRGGIANIGGEGQLYAGALGSVLAGIFLKDIPAYIHIPLSLLSGIVFAGCWGSLIAVLKVYFGAQEIITAIMLNYIMQYFVSFLVNYPLKEEGAISQTVEIADTAKLPLLSAQYQLSSGILLAVFIAVAMTFIYKKTLMGYEMSITGKCKAAARTAGINVDKTMIRTMFISGATAGLCGSVMILGSAYRLIDSFSSGYGFDGIAVASLANGSFMGVLLSGTFFGALRAGAMYVNRVAKIPYDFAIVIQALIIVLIATPYMWHVLGSKLKWKKKGEANYVR